jgi:hypothetical protein
MQLNTHVNLSLTLLHCTMLMQRPETVNRVTAATGSECSESRLYYYYYDY